jgi:hypothetical protein
VVGGDQAVGGLIARARRKEFSAPLCWRKFGWRAKVEIENFIQLPSWRIQKKFYL